MFDLKAVSQLRPMAYPMSSMRAMRAPECGVARVLRTRQVQRQLLQPTSSGILLSRSVDLLVPYLGSGAEVQTLERVGSWVL